MSDSRPSMRAGDPAMKDSLSFLDCTYKLAPFRKDAAMKLDDKDHRILLLLSQNGRLTNRELAAKIGVSPSTCLERVRRLEGAGNIIGYRAIISVDKPGDRFEAWAAVRFVEPTSHATEKFVELVQQTPAIVGLSPAWSLV